jgi:arsenate reductase
MTTVLFACVENAGRSQMAAAFFNQFADPQKARAISAGTHPAEAVHPEVAAVMREIGFDLTLAHPRLLSRELAARAQILVAMGCGEECPVVQGVERTDWKLPDPQGQPLETVRKIRDHIRKQVQALVTERKWAFQ